MLYQAPVYCLNTMMSSSKSRMDFASNYCLKRSIGNSTLVPSQYLTNRTVLSHIFFLTLTVIGDSIFYRL